MGQILGRLTEVTTNPASESTGYVRFRADRRQLFPNVFADIRSSARYRYDRSQLIEFFVCSQDSVQWSEPKCVPRGTESVPARLQRRGRAEHRFCDQADHGMTGAMPHEQLCRVAVRQCCAPWIFCSTTRHNFGPFTGSLGISRRGLPDGKESIVAGWTPTIVSPRLWSQRQKSAIWTNCNRAFTRQKPCSESQAAYRSR